MVLVNDQLAATQNQVQALQEQCYELAQTNKVLWDEIISLQKIVKAQSQVSNELINHLYNLDDRRRSSRHSGNSSHLIHSAPTFQSPGMGFLPDGADEPAPELRKAREILSGISPDHIAGRELERRSVARRPTGSPPDTATSSAMFTQPSAAGPMPLMHESHDDMRHLVYPVGQATGIDPFHSDHIQNIPYSRPLSTPAAMAEVTPHITSPPSKESSESLWGAKKPMILLVEDDNICSRIGRKFLSHIGCTVDVAVS
jgi:osomolarity two-component system response regulator SKN7